MGPSAADGGAGAFKVDSPHAIYSQQIRQRLEERATQRRRDRILGYSKLALVVLGIFFAARSVHELGEFGPLLATIAAFVLLAILHELVLRRIRRIDLVVAFYERGLARLEDRWPGTGQDGAQFIRPSHPYARDLDLFGRGSLFQLLSTARTRAGEETLARWLLAPAPPDEVEIRQRAVQELKDRMEFRANLFTAGNQVRLGLHPDLLTAWAAQQSRLQSKAIPVLALALGTLWIASVVFGIAGNFYWPLLLISSINVSLNSSFRKRLGDSIQDTEAATEDLDLLCHTLRLIEDERFSAARLVGLQASLRSAGIAASAAIDKLRRIASYLEQRRNLIIKVIDGFVFYTVLCMLKAEAWRRRFGTAIPTWLAAVGEMEALASLSCHAFEHPADAWPEFFSKGGARFEAESLAHPLLPESQAVRNDVRFGDGLQLIVLSGPNMSGKSTFVRGIGINAVLAQCGAPVRAQKLRMSPLALGASICVLDSLEGGVSRFYAEIQRLMLISDLIGGPIPLLFLLDELLSGTNSHDRLQGSELLVRSFVERGAIGLITTHDLALARIPDSLNGRARNYHFEDRLEDGKLRFDFRLKDGVVQTSNALQLMKSIGLLNQ
jgi:hypothetical protein